MRNCCLASAMVSSNLAMPAAAPAAELVEEAIESYRRYVEQQRPRMMKKPPWYIPNVRKYRCELIVDMPAPPGQRFKSCSYNCRGYGGPSQFPLAKGASLSGGLQRVNAAHPRTVILRLIQMVRPLQQHLRRLDSNSQP